MNRDESEKYYGIRYPTIPDYDYPRCSHNGFFAECKNDMTRRVKLSGSKSDMVQQVLFTGHLHYLNVTGELEASSVWERQLEDYGRKCHAHICLPDDPEQWISEQERALYVENKKMEPIWNRLEPVVNSLPQRMTLSVKKKSMRILQFWEWWEGSIVIITAHRRDSLERADGTSINLERLKKDERYRNTFNPDQLDLLASGCWAGMSHGIEIQPSNETNSLMTAFPLLKTKAGNDKNYTDSVDRAAMIAVIYLLFMSREPEDFHISRDPNWRPKKLTKKQRRKNMVAEPEPQKIRLYVPKRRVVTDPDAVLTESSKVGSKQKEHERDGHWRRYQNGTKIWIDKYTAGDAKLGSNINQNRIIEIVPRRKQQKIKTDDETKTT